MILGPQVCGDLTAGATREWLLPDGRGGYAMGTVSGLRTRRYHGLLVVAGDPIARRHLGLVSLDPVVTLPSGARLRLGSHEWRSGAVDPAGHTYLERFELVDGMPRWRWRIGAVVLERELAMAFGCAALAVRHRLLAGGPVTLTLDALCTWRDAHGERTAAGPPPQVRSVADGIEVAAAYRVAGPGFAPAGDWWLGAYLREEAARGLNAIEDLWHAGSFTGELAHPGDHWEVTAWAGDLATPPRAAAIIDSARDRRRDLVAGLADPVVATLTAAADTFVVTTEAGAPEVVAGYPWFGAWSRDTMLSYQGLFLATGRAEQGRELLRAYAATLSEGMLANTADTGRTEYNSADATLWFIHAVDRHLAATGDTDLAAELVPALTEAIAAHVRGTRYGIGTDASGLLRQGTAGQALTWMDARVGGAPVTQRAGKPVELNALWINALAAVAGLRERVGLTADDLRRRRHAAVRAFADRFPAGDRLHDVVDAPGGDDSSLRPNQLLAYSLPHAPLAADPVVLDRIAAALLTPLGLRSLAPESPAYAPAHRGGSAQRDQAYHQGTVWPWLLGPYVDACRRAGKPVADALAGITAHLGEWGLGSVSETADGDPPHAATGCPFQAWSVAEVLRVIRA